MKINKVRRLNKGAGFLDAFPKDWKPIYCNVERTESIKADGSMKRLPAVFSYAVSLMSVIIRVPVSEGLICHPSANIPVP